MPKSRWGLLLVYLYLLRFGIAIWVSMPLLVLADEYTPVSNVTRGLVALDSSAQLFWAAFVIVIVGWVAMLSSRIVCAYGTERFAVSPPRFMQIGQDMSWGVFAGAQLPGLFLLCYVLFRSLDDGRQPLSVAVIYLLAGILLAVVCWCLLAALYYWTYVTDQQLYLSGRMSSKQVIARGRLRLDAGSPLDANAFITPAWPKSAWRALEDAEPPAISQLFDRIFTLVASCLGPGFRKEASQPSGLKPKSANSPVLNSGHQLAIMALAFLLFVYGALSYYTAPIPMDSFLLVVRFFIGAILMGWLVLAVWYRWRKGGRLESALKAMILALTLLTPVWIFDGLILYGRQTVHGFPALAMVYLLLSLVLWGLSGLAFLFDRWRLPVLTTLVAVELVFHLLMPSSWQAEHIIQTEHCCQVKLSYPDEILNQYLTNTDPTKPHPLIIVTATGGGIHAAVWTAHILNLLEQKFQAKGLAFHDSILLMSSVSGGSFAEDMWLREYQATNHFTHGQKNPLSALKNAQTQMVNTVGCSSLEAIAWGLIYPDMLHLVLPLRIFENYDRGWALQQAVDRNRKDANHCRVSADYYNKAASLSSLTEALSQKQNGLGNVSMPAFSMNTTVAETGDRLLLSNYRLHFAKSSSSEILPARSFLELYGGTSDNNPAAGDLQLTGAARLSATFPYVSPMPRVSREVAMGEARAYGLKGSGAFHFGDGGYFDNDGTSTVIEFLSQAFCLGLPHNPSPGNQIQEPADPSLCTVPGPGRPQDDKSKISLHPKSEAQIKKESRNPIPILLIEIRDGGDTAGGQESSDDIKNQTSAKVWGSGQQLLGPLRTFLQTGHGGVTRRNRRELCILEEALGRQLSLTHIVFPFDPKNKRDNAQPLNWYLTPADKKEIEDVLQGQNGEDVKPGADVDAIAVRTADFFFKLSQADPRAASEDAKQSCTMQPDTANPVNRQPSKRR
jgi:hypothetical protein